MFQHRNFNAALCLFCMSLTGYGPQSMSEAIAQENLQRSAPHQGFAIVELFTSQGCSSCPSADQNLARISQEAKEKELPVYTLSFHVDYWNYLGWKDPYSRAECSQRQREYAHSSGSPRIYTPQMIVNGTTEFVGSDSEKSRKAINAALQGKSDSILHLSAKHEEDRVDVTWQSAGLRPGDMLNLALVQDSAQRHVTAGENSGRYLSHANVVRDFRPIELVKEDGIAAFELPAGFAADEYHVVAYIQSSHDSAIRAAARADVNSR